MKNHSTYYSFYSYSSSFWHTFLDKDKEGASSAADLLARVRRRIAHIDKVQVRIYIYWWILLSRLHFYKRNQTLVVSFLYFLDTQFLFFQCADFGYSIYIL